MKMPACAELAVAEGWADQSRLDAMAAAILAWGAHLQLVEDGPSVWCGVLANHARSATNAHAIRQSAAGR